jgi:hypothetical protein
MSRVALLSRATPVPVELVDENTAASSIPRKMPNRVPVGPLETFVLDYVDGRRTLADVAALVGLSLRETLHVLHRLRSLRAVELTHTSGTFTIEIDESWDRPSSNPTEPGK